MLRRRVGSQSSNDEKFGSFGFEQLVEALREDIITIKDGSKSLLFLLIRARHVLVEGVSSSSKELLSDVYYKVLGGLMVYGLAEFAKVPASAHYRRICLNADGRRFVARVLVENVDYCSGVDT